jgi:hypothetical protein
MRRMMRVSSKHRGVMVFLVLLLTGLIWASAAWAPGEPPPPPPPGDDGCTPGYWKNHLDEWGPTGLHPADSFNATFGVDFFDPDITLDQAVNARGGRINKVARHGTAALLNVLHPDVSYPLTLDEVIELVRAGLADSLADFNELGCPVDN